MAPAESTTSTKLSSHFLSLIFPERIPPVQHLPDGNKVLTCEEIIRVLEAQWPCKLRETVPPIPSEQQISVPTQMPQPRRTTRLLILIFSFFQNIKKFNFFALKFNYWEKLIWALFFLRIKLDFLRQNERRKMTRSPKSGYRSVLLPMNCVYILVPVRVPRNFFLKLVKTYQRIM